MTKPRISIIVAVSKNGAIGKGNQLLWRIPDDLKRFKRLTTGHPIIMGRKTYESIGRVLPERTNLVITRNPKASIPSCLVCHSLAEALEIASGLESEEIFIIGGAQVYKEAIGVANRIYITIVDKEFEGDAYFPDYSMFTKKLSEESGQSDNLKYSFLVLER